MWLILIVVLYFGMKASDSRETQAMESGVGQEETPPDYRPLMLFAAFRWIEPTVYSLLYSGAISIHAAPKLLHAAYNVVFWSAYLLSSICLIYVMGAILRKGLSPLPGLSTAAWTLLRWAAGLAFIIALTAHLPLFGVHDVNAWLNEMSVSFLLCICLFELSVLGLFLTQLRRLGMFLLSRPIGIAFGLALLGLLDVGTAVTLNAPPKVAIDAGILQEVGIIFVVTMWSFYILRPEPRRLPHSLSPASRLSKWEHIAKRIGVVQKDAEHVPFITTVESVVDSILERHKEKA